MKTLSNIFSQIKKISLGAAVFLLPLFFFPFTQEVLNFPKQTLLLFLVFIGLIGWWLKNIERGKMDIRGGLPFYLVIFAIFLFAVVSTLFSLWPTASFFGWHLDNSDNLLNIVIFAIFAFLLANARREDFFVIAFLLLFSGGLAAIFSLLQAYGVFILPFAIAKISSFNTLGDPYSAAVFCAALLPLSLLFAFGAKSYWKVFFGFITLFLFANVLLINFRVAWISLAAGISFLLFFGLSGEKEKIIKWERVGSLMLILVLSIFFIFFSLRPSGFPALPLQVSPSFGAELEVLKGIAGQGIKTLMFGTGPGTFVFDYSRYHSPLLNQTIFWGTRFASGGSLALDWFVTKGVLSGLSLFLLFGLLLYFAVRHFTEAEPEDSFRLKLGLSASIITLIISGFLFPFNFALWFLFWTFLGGFLCFLGRKKGLVFSPAARVFSVFFLLIIVVFSLTFFFLEGQRFIAEIYYYKGAVFSQKGEIEQAIGYIKKAAIFNPSSDIFWRDLSQLYLLRANSISQDEKLETEAKTQLVEQEISNGAQAINKAVIIAPANVANWNVRGYFYRNLIGVTGAGELALESYRKAIGLEPASPYAYGEMGRVYILIAQDFTQKEMNEAKEEALSLAAGNLNKAINLKSDYAPAHYLLAIVYGQQGKNKEAIAKLEEVKKTALNDAGIIFQLGVLYWREGELDKAQVQFEEAIGLTPNYSNARYMLGLVYDKKGEMSRAKEQFDKILEISPDNRDVKHILENIGKGLPALTGIIPSQPPLQEAPPEIQK